MFWFFLKDVEDLQEVIKSSEEVKLKESKAAKRLFKKVNSMIEKMDEVVTKLEEKEKKLKEKIEEVDGRPTKYVVDAKFLY